VLAIIALAACSADTRNSNVPFIADSGGQSKTSLPAVSSAAKTILTQGSIVVDDVSVSLAEVEEAFAKSPAFVKEQVTKEQYADLLINKKLLEAEARRRGYLKTPEDVERETAEKLRQAGQADDILAEEMRKQGMDKEEFYAELAAQQAIYQLVTEETPEVSVTAREVDNYFERTEPDAQALFDDQEIQVMKLRLKKSLEQEKKKEALTSFVNELREDAGIDPLP